MHHAQVHISYLEIYNNEGYDLLDADREVKAMEDLAQVGGTSVTDYALRSPLLESKRDKGWSRCHALPSCLSPLLRMAQVHVGEAEDGTVSYRNLSMYRANNEEEALNLVG